MKKYAMKSLITVTILVLMSGAPLTAKSLKPRVLVIPFDNMMGNQDYEWMKASISDNLKEKLTNTNKFDVMDVELLRKINPDIKFRDLTKDEATALSKKLNCEAAIIGRYITKQKEGKMNALIQVEAVNVLSNESILILSEYADLDGTVFKHVEELAQSVADEFVKKLPPISPTKNTRSNDLEKRIYRIEHPPKGFFDTLTFDVKGLDEKQKEKINIKPEFDIDTFEYDLYLPKGVSNISFKYDLWGRRFNPYITSGSDVCQASSCPVKEDDSEILISKTNKRDESGTNKEGSVIYKIRVHHSSLQGPVLGRIWMNAGYPFMKSFSFISPQGNPAALTPGGKFPFGFMNGILSAELGFSPGRWQLPAGINWSIVAQFQYAKGSVPLDTANSGIVASMDLFSIGGGFRIDRSFYIGNFYGVSPLIGFYVHYQTFNNTDTGASFSLVGINPEIGVIQYFRLGASSKWKISLTTVFGTYLYQDQNLSYIRANAGVEYAIK